MDKDGDMGMGGGGCHEWVQGLIWIRINLGKGGDFKTLHSFMLQNPM